MESVQTPDGRVRLRAENVGGIDESEVEFRRGVNLLTGWNASNRTSLLQALMAALGSERASLKADADGGRVELSDGEETYTRTLERRDGDVVFGGDPYTDDPELADLFAFLLESNDARQAVARDEGLREIFMRPVDTDEIQARIEELEARTREIDAELEDLERLGEERADLEEERADLTRRTAAKREALAAKREEIAAADAELEETRERKADLEEKLATLQDRRSTLEDVRFRLDTERETAEEVRAELAEVEAALEAHEEPRADEAEALERRTDTLRERKRALDSKISQLQALIQFNEEMVAAGAFDDLDVLEAGDGAGRDVTGQLLPEGGPFVCWTCGAETSRDEVEETVEALTEQRADLVEARRETTEGLTEAKERREELEEHERQRADLERRRSDLREALDDAEAAMASLRERREELVAETSDLDAAVESLREEEYDDVIDLHAEANALELELEQLESDLEGVEERLASLRERADEAAALEDEREDVRSRLAEARTRVERLEDEAVEAFNDHMDVILDVLGYVNIERIWIERVERQVRDGRRTVSRGFFDLHVVRSSDAGTVYEDTVAHLSESEREVTGLVFALAGYLVHDVHETMPFMLLDSIEAIDSNRIATLVEYLDEYAEYLVVALLPDDAEPVDDRHHRITDI